MSDKLFAACCLGSEEAHALWVPCPRDSDGSGEAGETREAGLDPKGDSAGRQASPNPQAPETGEKQ